MAQRRTLYPEIEPYETGMMDTGDGHSVYWETCGNPEGKPVVFLHGGPGAGCDPADRRFFDPERYRIVLFDQRGCGRSLPHASTTHGWLTNITTPLLIADIEELRRLLRIESWMVFGGSWGSTLSLAYAQRHPDRVSELVVRGVFTLRRSEVEWFYQEGASRIFPDLWEDYLAVIPEGERDDLLGAYSKRLFDADPAVHVPAALAWTLWEISTIRLIPDEELIAKMRNDPAAAIAYARIENHFFSHGGWLEEGELIARAAERLRGIPGVIVQGRYDVCTPSATAWDLHRAWPEAEFELVEDAGHMGIEPGILDALIRTTDRFALAAVAT